ncbi:MAG: gamma-glutamyl-gamma-aminobutyrate hydrolase family protein [Anaerolineae bacterium]
MSRPPLIGITARSESPSGSPEKPLYAVAQTYVQAVRRVGGLSLILSPVVDEEEAGLLLSRLDGLILSGGGDVAPARYGEEEDPAVQGVDPQRDRSELALTRRALGTGLPVLAICRGVQVLNVVLGGTLYQDISTQLPHSLPHLPADGEPRGAAAHPVRLAADSRLRAILGTEEVRVNSSHHQAAKDVGEGLVVTARAPDGVIEGLEYPPHPFCIGVQWHPESASGCQTEMSELFAAFVEAARGR